MPSHPPPSWRCDAVPPPSWITAKDKHGNLEGICKGFDDLSDRDIEVYALWTQRMTQAKIAKQIGVSTARIGQILLIAGIRSRHDFNKTCSCFERNGIVCRINRYV
jgi:hypothetical protein